MDIEMEMKADRYANAFSVTAPCGCVFWVDHYDEWAARLKWTCCQLHEHAGDAVMTNGNH